MNNYNKKILLILLILLVFGILVVFVFDINCIFKSVFHISCPGCGLTRGFRALFHLNLKEAIYYNILTVPIFLFLITIAIIYFIDIIKNKDYLKKYFKFFTKYYYLIIILIIISMIINNIKGI